MPLSYENITVYIEIFKQFLKHLNFILMYLFKTDKSKAESLHLDYFISNPLW